MNSLPPLEESLRQSIIDHNLELLYYLTMQPGNMIELGLALFIGAIVLTFAISKIHLLGKNGSASLLLTLFVVIVCTFFLIEVASFTKIWLLPKMGITTLADTLMGCAVGAAFLFMVVPFTRFLLHSGYFISMTSWLLGSFIALASIFLLSRTYEEPGSGATPIDTLERAQEHLRDSEDVIDSEWPEFETSDQAL